MWRGNTCCWRGMKRRQIKLKLKMKMNTRNLFITLGVAVMATVNVMAAEVALSPRASDHQAKIVSGTNTDPDLTAAVPRAISPRLAENRIKIVDGKDTTVSPSFLCVQRMSGTPKMVSACADHPGAAMPCCSVAANK